MKSLSALPSLLLSLACLAGSALAEGGRNYVHVVGSSTLLPYAEAVADHIAKGGKVKRPKLESTGAAGGFTLFCEGAGLDFPDIVNSPRPMKKTEEETCRDNGVGEIAAMKIGYDGLVLARSSQSQPFDLTRKTLYLAMAKQIPDPACKEPPCEKLIPNPYKTWKQIDPKLPDAKIEVFGPPVSSGAGEVFAEAVLEKGCAAYPWLEAQKAKNEKAYRRLCDNIRADGAYTEETGETVVSRLSENPNAVGLIAFARLRENAASLQAASVDGVMPTRESIAAKQYPIAHPLFFYVKNAHVDQVPGLKQYVTEFTQDKAWGEKGYLAARGLIPLEASERKLLVASWKPADTEPALANPKRAPENRKQRPSAKPSVK
jgi:phosphate transport system substrate-binding protein